MTARFIQVINRLSYYVIIKKEKDFTELEGYINVITYSIE